MTPRRLAFVQGQAVPIAFQPTEDVDLYRSRAYQAPSADEVAKNTFSSFVSQAKATLRANSPVDRAREFRGRA